jgi:hypothetical protein
MFRNLIFIGSSRSGSTWLAKSLGHHPKFKQPVKKPVRFWNRKIMGVSDNSSSHPNLSLNDYLEFFSPQKGITKCDITDGYSLLSQPTILAIKKYFPDALIVQIMRKPSDIVDSHFGLHHKIFDNIDNKQIRRQLISYSGYQKHNINQIYAYKMWKSFFPKNQFYLDFYEDFFKDPESSLNKLISHCGHNPDELDNKDIYFKKINQRISKTNITLDSDIRQTLHKLDQEYEKFRSSFK